MTKVPHRLIVLFFYLLTSSLFLFSLASHRYSSSRKINNTLAEMSDAQASSSTPDVEPTTPQYTLENLNEHTTREDLWLLIHDKGE